MLCVQNEHEILIKKVVLSFLIAVSPICTLANELSADIESIANRYFYRSELISLLYDNDLNYREIFKCSSIMFEKPNDSGGIDAACATKTDFVWISISIGPKQRPSSVYACPTKELNQLGESLVESAYDSKNIKNGKIYEMGLTNGWLRKFENVFFRGKVENEYFLQCWTLNRR